MRRGDEVVIAFHNRPFTGMGIVPDPGAVPARFTCDPATEAAADAVLFHLPTLDLVALAATTKPPGQLWVAWSLESRVMCTALDDREVMARFDLTMTYERTSDVWHPYFGADLLTALARPIVPVGEREVAPVAWLQANAHDANDRIPYVAELMRRVRVDSYGKVLRNRPEVIAPGAGPRIELYGRYKFVLALENSTTTDYVTEKVFDPLRAGAVPVYRGCPEVDELVPAPGCYIDTRDFASATELGAHLDALDRDGDAYLELHRWRSEPYRPGFLALIDQVRERPLCRLASAVAARLAEAAPDRGR